MRHLVSIERRATVAGDYDDIPDVWEQHAPAWIDIKPLQGQELLIAQQVQSKMTHRATAPFQAGVTSDMRIKLGTRTLEIDSVINVDERNRQLEFQLVEVT